MEMELNIDAQSLNDMKNNIEWKYLIISFDNIIVLYSN